MKNEVMVRTGVRSLQKTQREVGRTTLRVLGEELPGKGRDRPSIILRKHGP